MRDGGGGEGVEQRRVVADWEREQQVGWPAAEEWLEALLASDGEYVSEQGAEWRVEGKIIECNISRA